MSDLMISWIKKIEIMNLKNKKYQMFVENKSLKIKHQLNLENKQNLRYDENVIDILNSLDGMTSSGSNQTHRLCTMELKI